MQGIVVYVIINKDVKCYCKQSNNTPNLTAVLTLINTKIVYKKRR